MQKIIILGSGLAGLAAAFKLSENKNNEIIIIEKEKRPGGFAKTISINGNLFDIGPHRFHSIDEEIIMFFKNIMKKDFLIRRKYSEIYFNCKFLKYPISLYDLLFKLNPFESIHTFLSYLFEKLTSTIKIKEERNLEEWINNRFGRELNKIYFRPYTEKVWGISTTQISVDWAIDRIPLISLRELIKKTILSSIGFNKNIKHHHSPYLSSFIYPKYGIGDFTNRIFEVLKKRNVLFLFQSEVIKIKKSNNKIVSIITKDSNNKENEILGDFFINTIPITEFIKNVNLPIEKLEVFNTLKFRSILFIFVLLNKKRISKNHWIYFPQKDIIFNRLTEMKNFSPHLNTENKTGIILEIAFSKGDKIDTMTEKEITSLAIADLEILRLIKKNNVLETKIYKNNFGYPIYLKSYKKTLSRLLKNIGLIENLKIAGRQAYFKYLNMDQVIRQGFDAAEEIMKKLSGN